VGGHAIGAVLDALLDFGNPGVAGVRGLQHGGAHGGEGAGVSRQADRIDTEGAAGRPVAVAIAVVAASAGGARGVQVSAGGLAALATQSLDAHLTS
jgi:hypothetical protein